MDDEAGRLLRGDQNTLQADLLRRVEYTTASPPESEARLDAYLLVVERTLQALASSRDARHGGLA